MVSLLKLKIDETKGETKRNVNERQIKSITNFHNDNKEHPMQLLSLLMEEILPQLNFTNDFDKINTFQQYMNTVCVGQAARQWRQIKMNAKRDILKAYIDCGDTKSYSVEDERREDIIIGSKFKEWLDERKAATAGELAYMEATSGQQLWKWLVESYHYRVIDHMNKLIFGEDVHKVLDQQIEYLKNKIIQPFGVGVKASFERIETLISYMKLFPPATKKDEFPTLKAHKEHENFIIAERTQRQIYLNVLPEEAYQIKFTTDCEKDYPLIGGGEYSPPDDRNRTHKFIWKISSLI